MMDTIHPALLTTQERQSEIGRILAVALLRIFNQETSQNASNSLDFRVYPSIHGRDNSGGFYEE
jgi:hypothetical protein